MNKLLKRILSAGLSVLMIPAFGGASGVKAAPATSFGYNFDTTAQFDSFKSVFYEKYQEKESEIWRSALVHDLTNADITGNTSGAIHVSWSKADAIGKNDKGKDSFFRLANPDYSGKAYTSFDFKLDNKNSSIQVYDRVPVGGKTSSFVFMNATGSVLKVFDSVVDVDIVPGTWYRFSAVTEYDGDKTITASAWINGECVADGVEKSFSAKPDCIDGTTASANFLTFTCYYSANGETGAWFDNIVFNQAENVNINSSVSATPKNGSNIETGDFSFEFSADVDKLSFNESDLRITKNGEVITPDNISLLFNKLDIKLNESDIEDGYEYEIVLPAISDYIGNTLDESKRTYTYSTPEYIPLEMISPCDGSFAEKGKAMVFAVKAAPDVDYVNFKVNGEDIEGAVKEGDIWKLTWIPERYGNYSVEASWGEYNVSADDIKVMKSKEQANVWSLGGTYFESITPVYDGDDGRNPKYALSGEKSCGYL